MLYAWYGETYGRSRGVITIGNLIPDLIDFPKPFDGSVMSREEHKVLSRRVEISGVLHLGPSDSTTWRERGVVLFPDDSQSKGGSGGRVVRFYDPRFVLLHANSGVETEHDFPQTRQRLIQVCRETTRRRETGVESDDDRFDGHPFLVTSHVRYDG